MFRLPRTAGPVLLAISILFASQLQAAVSPEVEQRILAAADTWRENKQQRQQMQQVSGDPHMAAVSRSLDRQVYASLIAQAVIDSIARDPGNAGEAATIAVNAAPELSAEIQASLAMAFPRMERGVAPTPVAVPKRPKQQAAIQPRAPPAASPDLSEADAAAAEAMDLPSTDRDPLEDVNRAIFALNDFLDSYVMVPIAKTYRFIMPEALREMGRNFFENFNEPVVAINDALQGDFENAGVSLGRFIVNSTVGLFGFFEVAERVDLKEHPADFGQTLHTYGVDSGPYLMLPFFGPSTVRDAVGKGVDSFLNPISYLLDFETRLYLKASETVVKRENVLDELEELRKGSLDYYAAVRSAWFQNRAQELRKGEPPDTENIDELFADVK